MRTFKVALLFVGLFLFVSPVFAQSSTTQAQIDALLAQIRVLQERLAQMQGSISLKGCVDLSYNLYADRTDAQTGGEVSKLQMFLAQTPHIYPSGLITGYFGPATEVAVQKWQAAAGIVSSGSPETTGYGYVGPKTRSLMSCGSPIPQTIPPVVTTPPIVVSESCTITASKTSVGVGESYTISWTTRNIDDPVMYEEVKAGGTVEINKRGSKEFTTPYVGTDTYQIGAGGLSAPYRPLCSVSVNVKQVESVGTIDQNSLKALSQNPVIMGTANVSTVGLALGNSGGKMYGSGPISVNNGVWSHRIGGEWPTSDYTVSLYSYPENVLLSTASYVTPSATINQNSLLPLPNNPTISGTAIGVSSVGIAIGNSGGKMYGSGSISVLNGTWSHQVGGEWPNGSYTVQVYSPDNILLTTANYTQ